MHVEAYLVGLWGVNTHKPDLHIPQDDCVTINNMGNSRDVFGICRGREER
jgi:hypothetical protein